MEFSDEQVVKENIQVPEGSEWRFNSENAFYEEWRAGGVKLYHQKKIVDYADYRIGMWYASPVSLKDFVKVGKYEPNTPNSGTVQ